jgi:PAS domain S-box-containing protein
MKAAQQTGTRGLLAGFLMVIGLLLALAGVGLVYLQSMNQTISRIVEGNNERTRLVTEMYISARERALQLHAILQEPDPFARDALVPRFHELGGVFRGAREKLLQMPLSQLEHELLNQQATYTARGSQAQDAALDLALADRTEEAVKVLLSLAIPSQNLATLRLRQLLDEQIRNGRESASKASAGYQLARDLMLASALIATLLASLIAVLVIRRQARLLASLQAREREAALLLDSIPAPVWFKDLAGRIVRCNDAFARIAGRAAADVLAKQEADFWGPAEGSKSEQADRQALETGQMQRQDRRLTLHNGMEGHYIIARAPIADDAGAWRGVLCVATDLTTIERMNDLLEATNLELQAQKTALDEHAIVSITDTDGAITYVNDKFCAISGYTREELLGQNHRMLNSELHPSAFFETIWQTITSGKVWHGEIRNRRRDGSFYWLDSTFVPFLGLDGKPTQYIAIRTDISARKRMEESLQDINVELQKRVDERTAALSRAKQQLEADIAERNQSQVLLQQQFQQLEGLHHELQNAQSQLLQSEKLASIGQLAAGVAHEINNPIGFVHSNLGTLENYIRDLFRIIEAYEACEATLPPDAVGHGDIASLRKQLDLPYLKEDIPALMNESRDGITRVRKIIQDLKDFSRLDSTPDWQYANLHQGLDSTLNIVHNEIKYHAEVVKEYGDLPEVECLPSQMNQVFMNLLVNAAHAIEGPRGTITVRSGRAGEEAWVEVADTGKGIPEDALGRIFDPFYTTKPVGKGTGLGLSLAYGIIQKHNGRIEVKSEVGKGTTFRVTLPIKHVEQANEV